MLESIKTTPVQPATTTDAESSVPRSPVKLVAADTLPPVTTKNSNDQAERPSPTTPSKPGSPKHAPTAAPALPPEAAAQVGVAAHVDGAQEPMVAPLSDRAQRLFDTLEELASSSAKLWSTSHKKRKALRERGLELLEDVDRGVQDEIRHHLYTCPAKAGPVLKLLAAHEYAGRGILGDNKDTYGRCASLLGRVKRDTSIGQANQARWRSQLPVRLSALPVTLPNDPEQCYVYGRTIQLTDEHGETWALKVPKRRDKLDVEEMSNRRFATYKDEDDLEGEFPESVGLVNVTLPPKLYEAVIAQSHKKGSTSFTLAAGPGQPMECLLYKPPPEYEVYMPKLPTISDLRASLRRCAFNSARVARRRQVHCEAPIDAYHNANDQRVHDWSVESVGRMADWRIGVENPNYGRNLRDTKNYEECILDWEDSPFYTSSQTCPEARRMGNVLLSLSMCAVRWFEDHGNIRDADLLADTLLELWSVYTATFTDTDEKHARKFYEATIDWKFMARQHSQSVSPRWRRWLAAERRYIFPKDCKVSEGLVRQILITGLCCQFRMTMNPGRPRHLGPPNGVFPWTETTRALHIGTSMCLGEAIYQGDDCSPSFY